MRILLFSNFELPCSCANASRVFAFAKICAALNYDVEIVGVSYRKNAVLKGSYEGFTYSMILAESTSGIKSIKRIRKLNKDIQVFLEKAYYERHIDAVLLSNFYYDHTKVFFDFSSKFNVPLIVNSVEWYDRNNDLFSGIFGKIRLLQNRIALRVLHPKMRNVIAISSLLGDYYSKKKCNVIVVPTILDIREYEGLIHLSNNKIVISYAGSPAKKDYIKNVVLALQYLSKDELNRIELHFYGATKIDFFRLGVSEDFLHKYSKNVICHGRIPYEEVKLHIAASDFTVLLRPNEKYANAGFPTKVGESMACGTPVLANITSDLSKYIIDGSTGVISKNESSECCAEALKIILNYKDDELEQMRFATHLMARQKFDYMNYVTEFDEFMKALK